MSKAKHQTIRPQIQSFAHKITGITPFITTTFYSKTGEKQGCDSKQIQRDTQATDSYPA